MRTVSAFILILAMLVGKPAGQVHAGEGAFGFVRNDQVLTWRTGHTGSWNPAPGTRVGFESTIQSSLNMTSGPGVTDRWYDTVYHQATISQNLRRNLSLELRAREDWNRDTYNRFGESLLTTTIVGNLTYRPTTRITLAGGVGRLDDRRFDNRDSGATGTARVSYRTNPARALEAAFSLEGATADLRRADDQVGFSSRIGWRNRATTVSLDLADMATSKGYFSDIDRVAIEERSRRERDATLTIAHGGLDHGAPRLGMLLSYRLGSRQMEDTANDNTQSAKYHNNAHGTVRDGLLVVTRGLGNRIATRWEAGYLYDANTVERRLRSRTQTDVSLKGAVAVRIGEADTLATTGWIKRTRIDTPTGVVNDRDELKAEGGLRYVHRIGRNVQTLLDFRALETHYVNIDASQSTQNKWVKTYLVAPGIVYNPSPGLRWSHVVTVYANRMEFDFDTSSIPRSSITRRVTAESRIDAELTSRSTITLAFLVEENDYGNLDGRGRKLPVEEGIRRYGDVRFTFIPTDWLTLAPRYTLALRRDDSCETGNRIRREVDRTYGVDGTLFKNRRGDCTLEMSVKRIVRTTDAYPVRIRTYVDLQMRYVF